MSNMRNREKIDIFAHYVIKCSYDEGNFSSSCDKGPSMPFTYLSLVHFVHSAVHPFRLRKSIHITATQSIWLDLDGPASR